MGQAADNAFSEFLRGLSPEDTIAAVNDQIYFGTAIVFEENGVKRRIAPEDWHRYPASEPAA